MRPQLEDAPARQRALAEVERIFRKVPEYYSFGKSGVYFHRL